MIKIFNQLKFLVTLGQRCELQLHPNSMDYGKQLSC